MNDQTPLNVYQDDYDDYDYDDRVEVNTTGPWLGAVAGAGLAILSCLILIGLCSTIVHRDRSSISISHLIMVIICLLIAAAGAFFVLKWKQGVQNPSKSKMNWLVYGLIFVLVCVCACYCFASAIYYYMYRPFHFAKLSSYNTEEWKDSFIDSWTFERGWKEDRRIIWWIAFFTALAGLGLLILAVSMWVAASDKTPLAKMLLAVACFAGILLALFALHYLWKSYNSYKNFSARSIDKTNLVMLAILFVLGIIILLANLVINLLKRKGLYFLFGFLLVFFLVVFIVFLGLALRNLRQKQFSSLNNNANCAQSLHSIHENSVSEFCSSGKYLAAGKLCTKDYMVQRWENKKEVRFLNPGCCNSMTNYNSWPLYILGCLGLLFLTAVMTAIIANFYLGDAQDYLSDFQKSLGIIELAMLGLAVLALIAFAFWFGFRPKDKVLQSNDYLPERDEYGNYNDDNFTPVDLKKVYGGNVPQNVQINSAPKTAAMTDDPHSLLQTQNQVVSLKQKTNCTDKCGARAAVLATNAKLVKDDSLSIYGTNDSRHLFFADSNSNSDYAMIYGNEADVSSWLAGLQLQPIQMSKPSNLYVSMEEFSDISVLNQDGLKSTESKQTPTLTSGGAVFNGAGYTMQGKNEDCQLTNSCESTLVCDFNSVASPCKRGYHFFNNGGVVNVYVPYRVYSKDKQELKYNGDAHVEATYEYQGKKYSQTVTSFTGGDLHLKVPNPYREDYDLKLLVSDNSGRYLKDIETITIPVKSSNELRSEKVYLLTSDGRYCSEVPPAGETAAQKQERQQRVEDCWDLQSNKKTDVEVVLRTDDTNAPVNGALVELYQDDTPSSPLLASAKTNSEGIAVFKNMGYDRYYAKYPGSSKFLPEMQSTLIQGELDGDLTMLLHRRDSGDAVVGEYMPAGSNQDLAINVKNYNNNNECTLEPTNKYCAYMVMEDDIDGASAGYERAKIQKFTESYYLAYRKPTPTYSSSCSVSTNGSHKYYENSSTTVRSLKTSFKWDRIRKAATTTFKTLYCFNGWGLSSKVPVLKTTSAEPKAASECPRFYPSGTKYALDRLKSLNNQ